MKSWIDLLATALVGYCGCDDVTNWDAFRKFGSFGAVWKG